MQSATKTLSGKAAKFESQGVRFTTLKRDANERNEACEAFSAVC